MKKARGTTALTGARGNEFTAKLVYEGSPYKVPELSEKNQRGRNAGVVQNYRRFQGRGKTLSRLDLTQSGGPDRFGTTHAINVHPFEDGKIKSNRVMVSRAAPISGMIDFTSGIDQKDVARIQTQVDKNYAKLSEQHKSRWFNFQSAMRQGLGKRARHGVVGEINPQMTKDQIKKLIKHGIKVQFDPLRGGVFTVDGGKHDGKVIKNFRGHAVSWGSRVYVMDEKFSTRGVSFYSSLAELPEEIRDRVQRASEKPYSKELKWDEKPRVRVRGGGGGGFGAKPEHFGRDKTGRRQSRINM
jgi:hypothetical protein